MGAGLSRPFVCFAQDAPLTLVARYLDTTSTAFGFPVVDARGRLVGTLGRARAALALASSRGADHRVGPMALPSRVVSERESIAVTLSSMRERGGQELMVLGEDEALVGVLRDIDALRMEAGSEVRIQLAG